MTLYQILGVEPGADAATIKAAHRRLAKEHHPDRGGDPARFATIQHAYDILGNDEKRRRYDETGDDGTANRGPSEFGEMAKLVVGAFDRAIGGAPDFKRADIVAKMLAVLRDDRQRGEQAQRAVEKARVDMTEMRRRLGFGGDDQSSNIIDGMLRGRLQEADRQFEANKQTIARLDRAMEHVRLYGWEVDVPQPAAPWPFDMASIHESVLRGMMTGSAKMPFMINADELRFDKPRAERRWFPLSHQRRHRDQRHMRPHTCYLDDDGKQVPRPRGSWAAMERKVAEISA